MGYNAAGQRDRYTATMSGTATTDERFQYRDGALAQMAALTATLNGDGSLKATGSYTDTYVYTDSGQPLELLRQQSSGTKRYWYVLDGRGNVVALTDVNGTVVDRYAYDPWGEGVPEGTNESVPQPFRYAGYWWNKELGWYWVSVRSYDPEGRWLQPDPSQRDGVRTYAYVGDDPIDRTDPTGLDESGVAGIDTGNGVIDFIIIGATVVGGTVVAVAAAPEVLIGASVYIGAAVVIGGVTYVVTRIRFGPTRTVTMPAYIPRPGEVQASPVAGGTTVTIPSHITVPTYHTAASIAGEIENLNGKTREQADELLRSRGATKKVTAGGYVHYKFPDKSEIVIRPDGRVVRIPAPEYGPNGERTNKGGRLDQHGQPTTSHDTGERLRD